MIKKVIGLLVVLIVAGSLTVLGENNNFVPSISTKDPVTIVGEGVVTNTNRGSAEIKMTEDDGCEIVVVLTTYKDRNKLVDVYKEGLEDAYQEILDADAITDLSIKLDQIAKELNISSDELVVSELFDVHIEEISSSGEHIPTNIHAGIKDFTFKTSSAKNLVSLLHYKDGVWETVESAEMLADLQAIRFSSESLSPFAVVLRTNRTPGGNGGNGTGGNGGYNVPNTGVK